jgi:hypothetical protein
MVLECWGSFFFLRDRSCWRVVFRRTYEIGAAGVDCYNPTKKIEYEVVYGLLQWEIDTLS